MNKDQYNLVSKEQLIREIVNLKEERHQKRDNDRNISQVFAIFIVVFTLFIIISTLFDVNEYLMSVIINIIACIYIIRDLKIKTVKVYFNDDTDNSVFTGDGFKLYTLSQEKLNQLLSESLNKENYILAAKVRDELKKFKK